MENILKDIRFSLRQIARYPTFSVLVILSLALAIGPNTAIFTVINTAFLRPMGYTDPASLVSVFGTDEKYPGLLPVSYPNFEDLRDRNQVLSSLVVLQPSGFSLVGGSGNPERIFGQFVSGNYFDMLGVKPAIGRTFLPEDYAAMGAAQVVVLSHGLWTRRYGADPSIIGKTITLNSRQLTVIGVGPKGFAGTNRITVSEVWVPITLFKELSRFGPMFDDRDWRLFNMLGRMKPGVTLEQAEGDLQRVAAILRSEFPDVNKSGDIELTTITEDSLDANDQPGYARGSLLLLFVVGLLLAIAAANVASLLLSRAFGRRREIAIRLAMGATRGQIVRQLLVESVLLSLIAGAVGLILAYFTRDLLWHLRPAFIPEQTALHLVFDLRVLFFTIGVSVLVGLLFGLVPALQSSNPQLVSGLSGRDALAINANRWYGLRGILVIGQVALCFVSLAAAALLTSSFRNVQQIDVGYEVDKLLVVTFNLGGQGYNQDRIRNFHQEAIERVSQVPGVVKASVAFNRPIAREGLYSEVIPLGTANDGQEGVGVRVDSVGADYFETVGIPILRGRAFTTADRMDGAPVCIVNETMETSMWRGDAIGKQLRIVDANLACEVVGVARNAKYQDVREDKTPYFYRPMAQNPTPVATLWVRTAGDPASVLQAVRREVQSLDENLPLVPVETVAQRLAGTLWAPRLAAVLISVFGLLALVLAATGIYGSLAFSVENRRREIAIRMAVGGRPRDILFFVMGQGALLAAIGIAVGLAAALLGSRLLRGMLYGIPATDLVTLVSAALFLALVAVLASLIPAWRAVGLPPTTAMRQV